MSMFSQIQSEPTCTTVDECVQNDKLSNNLWTWAHRLETLGMVLFVFLLVYGIYAAVQGAMVGVVHYQWVGLKTEFDFMVFLVGLIDWAIYAFIEYCLYHVVALLIGALAGIYQNTKATARLQEYQLRNLIAQEASSPRSAQSAETVRDVAQAEQKEAVPSPVVAPSGSPRGYGTVCCPQCGRSQSNAREKCYQCGAPLKTE